MKKDVIINRTEIFSPIYKEIKQVLMPSIEIDNLLSKLLVSNKNRTIHCNSSFAEETINVIIDYFNEQSRLDTDFKKNILGEINDTPFPYHIDNQKLMENIEVNNENSIIASAKGMKNILGAFIKYSDFTERSDSTYFEDINYIIEPVNDVNDSSHIWIEQTIDEPWYK